MSGNGYQYYHHDKIELTHTGGNHNKFYHMTKNYDGITFTIKYGRIGNKGVEKIYPLNKWKDTIDNKIQKGYDVINAYDNYSEPSRLSDSLKTKMDKLSNLSKIYKIKKEFHKKIFNEIEIISTDVLTSQVASATQLSRITELYKIITDDYGYKINF